MVGFRIIQFDQAILIIYGLRIYQKTIHNVVSYMLLDLKLDQLVHDQMK